MAKKRTELKAEVARLTAELDAARAADRAGRTLETMQAVKAAWSRLSAAMVALEGPPKTHGFASRAGQRQAAERRAMHRQR